MGVSFKFRRRLATLLPYSSCSPYLARRSRTCPGSGSCPDRLATRELYLERDLGAELAQEVIGD